MAAPRLPPPRPPLPSSPDMHAEIRDLGREVFQQGARSDARVSALEAKVDLGLAGLRQDVAALAASGRTETLKILAGAVVTLVTAVVGSRALAPATPPPPTPTVVPSAFDACRDLPAEEARLECLARIARQGHNRP